MYKQACFQPPPHGFGVALSTQKCFSRKCMKYLKDLCVEVDGQFPEQWFSFNADWATTILWGQFEM